ncbi:hypothetical protein [Mycoplana azooxidifex]|uniref:hypothetical protein n=1 Tax=Mycoplana azooxidifex TaxID=1636188 RepID=UPI00160CAA26|nr:hypothetical protein [Mycoplana azooxidifex]
MKGYLKAPFGRGQESLARFDKHRIAEYRFKTRAEMIYFPAHGAGRPMSTMQILPSATKIVVARAEDLASTFAHASENRKQKRSGRNRTDLPHNRSSTSASTSVVKGRQRLRQLRATDAFQRSSAMPMTGI